MKKLRGAPQEPDNALLASVLHPHSFPAREDHPTAVPLPFLRTQPSPRLEGAPYELKVPCLLSAH